MRRVDRLWGESLRSAEWMSACFRRPGFREQADMVRAVDTLEPFLSTGTCAPHLHLSPRSLKLLGERRTPIVACLNLVRHPYHLGFPFAAAALLSTLCLFSSALTAQTSSSSRAPRQSSSSLDSEGAQSKPHQEPSSSSVPRIAQPEAGGSAIT